MVGQHPLIAGEHRPDFRIRAVAMLQTLSRNRRGGAERYQSEALFHLTCCGFYERVEIGHVTSFLFARIFVC